MSELRNLIDILENIEAEPEIGDIVEIELGDLLIETTISELLEDGVALHVDAKALELMIEAKEKLDENMVMGVSSDARGGMLEDEVDEAKYQGREVKLGKPFFTPDGPKKRSVYVKNSKGNVVKVNFGDKKMRIKKSSPAHRKSFRARHRCDNPGPRWKARYWSCRMW